MNLNVENLVRSGVVLVVGLPLALSVTSLVNTTSELVSQGRTSQSVVTTNDVKAELTLPCINYMVSKIDSKLERESKTQIDDILGGEVEHKEVCKWVL